MLDASLEMFPHAEGEVDILQQNGSRSFSFWVKSSATHVGSVWANGTIAGIERCACYMA